MKGLAFTLVHGQYVALILGRHFAKIDALLSLAQTLSVRFGALQQLRLVQVVLLRHLVHILVELACLHLELFEYVTPIIRHVLLDRLRVIQTRNATSEMYFALRFRRTVVVFVFLNSLKIISLI